MPYRQIIDFCFADRIGAGGLDAATWVSLGSALAPVVQSTADGLEYGGLAPISVARRRDDLPELIELADTISDRARDVLVLGIGGSSLGGQTLLALRGAAHQHRPRLHFVDNIDPTTWQAVLDGLDPATLHVLAVSKSGGTAETLAQALLVAAHLSKTLSGDELGRHFTVITEPGDRPLRRFAERTGARILDHDPDVGGRFSALTLVGLLPAAIAGLDIEAVRSGATIAVEQFLYEGTGSAPALGAALAIGLARSTGKSVPGCADLIADRLERLSAGGMFSCGRKASARAVRVQRRYRRAVSPISTASLQLMARWTHATNG